MMAPKGSLFLAALTRRKLYFVAIVLVLSCGGPEVPQEIPQAMEWRFDEPQVGWKPVIPDIPTFVPAEVSFTGDALRLTLTDRAQLPNSRPPRIEIYTDLPDLNLAEWDTVVVRTRSQVDITVLRVGINLRESSSPPTVLSGRAFKKLLWRMQERPDGTERTYRFPVNDQGWDWGEPWRHLGLDFFTDQPGSIDLLSVSLVPKAAGLRVSESTAQKCLGLKTLNPEDLPNPTTVITVVHMDAAQTEGRGDWAALPEHCRIQGKMNERIGEDGLPYAINFRMRLPTDWNGRFFFEGTGGGNGRLTLALGTTHDGPDGLYDGPAPPFNNALNLGYAVVNEDGGWDRQIQENPQNSPNSDPQARIDQGYNSLDQTTQAAKALIKAYYGRMPEKSYFWGQSGGGRQAMTMSQRFPDYFDGIVAMAPGFLRELAHTRDAWTVQAFAEAARAAGLYDEFGYPAVNKTFTDDDFVLVSNAVLEVCDTLDGLADGIVDNFPTCTNDLVGVKLAELICSGVKEPDCLSEPQVTALLKAQAGAKNSQGEQFFADRPWDAGIGGKVGDRYFNYWRGRKIGSYNSTENWGEPSVMAEVLAYDFDTDPQEVFETTETYTESAWTKLAWDPRKASSTELSAFKNRGSKLIMVQGVSDPIILTNDLINWWEEVDRINEGKAADFVRLFAVPGGDHGFGGPATGQFDALSTIVDWVENGIAPERIIGTAGDGTAWPNRTRPLCPYPQQARYKGSGSIEDASNFVCDSVRD